MKLKEYKGLKIPKTLKKGAILYTCNTEGKGCLDNDSRFNCSGISCTKCICTSMNLNASRALNEYLNEGGKDVSEFKKGDYVEITEIQDGGDYIGQRLKVTRVHQDSEISVICETPDGHTWFFNHGNFKALTTKTQTTRENNMNKNISEVFDKTKDALLVEKHLGNQLGTTFIDGLILADKKTEVLAEAKRLEKEEKDK